MPGNRVVAGLVYLALVLLIASPCGAVTAESGDLRVAFDTDLCEFTCGHAGAGELLTWRVLELPSRQRDAPFRFFDARSLAGVTEATDDGQALLTVRYKPGVTVVVSVDGKAGRVDVEAIRSGGGGRLAVLGVATMGEGPLGGWLRAQQGQDGGVLTTTLGAPSLAARALFDPARDVALGLDEPLWFRVQPGNTAYTVWAEAGKLSFTVLPHYYRDTLGIEHYAPIEKRSYWRTAPCVAMTWYGLPGWTGNPAQTEARLYPQVDWVAKNLLPYDPNLIFQLDDNYAKTDDAVMRDISDYIRGKGLIPGIWFTPYTVAPVEVYDSQPEWFLHNAGGDALRTFGGISYSHEGHAAATLDVAVEGAVDGWFRPWWEKASDTWNYDFFKIDGQPQVINAYRQARGAAGVEDYRRGLDIARSVVGPDKFINGCWGTPLEAIGKVNGSRTGGDTGGDPHAINIILRWNFLNNVAWWSDPDAAANLAGADIERVRLNTQARALTGQQFLTDEVWTNVPPEVAYVWQRGMPTADVYPANLYPIDNWAEYDVWDLKIAKPFERWDVVGVFNYGAEEVTKAVPLRGTTPGLVNHVYDYWDDRYLGAVEPNAELEFTLKPYEGKLLSIHRAEDRPVVLSTSRHITQGGLDLEGLTYRETRDGWIIEGRSSHLVHRDEYMIVLHAGGCQVTGAWSDGGPVRFSPHGEIARVVLTPVGVAEAKWRIELKRRLRSAFDVHPDVVDLGVLEPGGIRDAEVRVSQLGPVPAAWDVHAHADWLEALPSESGDSVLLRADTWGLRRGAEYVAQVVVGAEDGAGCPPRYVAVRLRTVPPANLALEAHAEGSSVWSEGYEAGKVNDGDDGTRWNSAQGDRDGAWIALRWDEPCVFDSVVIDEVIDWGHRVRSWLLEVEDDGAWRPIARGGTLGPGRRIEGGARSAKALRLRILEATDVPTISEIRVYDSSG